MHPCEPDLALRAQGFSGCYSLFFFASEIMPERRFFTQVTHSFTQGGSLYNLIICMKEEREGSPSVKTQLHFFVKKCT